VPGTPGWYSVADGGQRYWDGRTWTASTKYATQGKRSIDIEKRSINLDLTDPLLGFLYPAYPAYPPHRKLSYLWSLWSMRATWILLGILGGFSVGAIGTTAFASVSIWNLRSILLSVFFAILGLALPVFMAARRLRLRVTIRPDRSRPISSADFALAMDALDTALVIIGPPPGWMGSTAPNSSDSPSPVGAR
jgi:hypothetical protein